MDRLIGILFGVLTQCLFGFTVYRLFCFLAGRLPVENDGALWIDGLLALAFAVPHSVLLLPKTRQVMERWIRPELYGCFYCAVTCASLLMMFACWRTHPASVWQSQGWVSWLIRGGFYGSWLALLYSLSLTGLGYQTGWTQWQYWFRGRSLPRREFRPRGLYRWLRHPVYLSFLGLIWFTPRMTLDHAVLTAIWTIYIFIGSYLKDERLAYYLQESYRAYQRRVPGYPLMPFGPLARARSPGAAATVPSPRVAPVHRPPDQRAA